MFLALGVAGLILLTGTDLSVGRMVGMGMTTATIIMHQGVNTGGVFGHIFDFTKVPTPARVVLALVACIVLCTFFTSIAGFFTAKFKMHPFISTMANMLVIFGLVTYATKGVSFGAMEPDRFRIKIQKHHIEKRDDYDKKTNETSYLYGSRVCNITDCRDNLLFII